MVLLDGQIKQGLIDIAPSPTLARLDGARDSVLAVMKMFRGVLAYGRIAAADMPARKAHAEMHPLLAGFQTLFAAAGVRFHVMDLIKVRTARHRLYFETENLIVRAVI
jgi:hypothetical protein